MIKTLSLFFLLFIGCVKSEYKKPLGIPFDAYPVGNENRLRWVQVVSHLDSLTRIKIFLDPQGTLFLDANYTTKNIRGTKDIAKVFRFIDDEGNILVKTNDSSFYMHPEKPAFDGVYKDKLR